MKKALPWILFSVFALELLAALLPRKDKEWHLASFGRLPILSGGRMQPFDSVARNSLLQIRGTQSVPLEGNGAGGSWGEFNSLLSQKQGPLQERKWWQFHRHPKRLKPSEWVAELMMKPETADTRFVFLIHHPELLGQYKLDGKGVENSGLHYFSFNELRPSIQEIAKQARQISESKRDASLQTAVDKQVLKLFNALSIYQGIKVSLKPVQTDDFVAELAEFQKNIGPGVAALKAREAGKPFDQKAFDDLVNLVQRYDETGQNSIILAVPPAHQGEGSHEWVSVGASLVETVRGGEIAPAVNWFAAMCTAWRHDDPISFNTAVDSYRDWIEGKLAPQAAKGREEYFFNNLMPFYRAMLIYLFAFILGCAYWVKLSEPIRKSAVLLIGLAWVVHTVGILFRMKLEGRPPVTNLYSSAVFIGWGTVLLGLILERIYKGGIGAVVAAFTGFTTQIIAHNLALGGDTMKMLVAVLDTNFWLATHVIVVTLGYSSTFVAGFLAIVYIVRGTLTTTLDDAMSKALNRMVYGIVCFATLFSFVGTVLGGIWADQSWGRFWGWDPKENGALIIVLWNAIILHARWGGWARERGIMNMAVFGNIVTSFSWFGVNMLGVGLHSYGFMDEAFKWLMAFIASQAVIMALGLIPLAKWRSFRHPHPAPRQPATA